MIRKLEILFADKRWSDMMNFIFPIILIVFSFIHIGTGITITDTGYNYGNFVFFDQLDDMWKFSTYIANGIGAFFVKLPFGYTLIGLNFYTGLIKIVTALSVYYFCINVCKMRKEMVFVGELIALGFCWCPTAIMYNYMTYFLFHIVAILIYLAIVRERRGMFILAGVILGINLFVRLPNLAECALILVVWFADIVKKSKWKKVLLDTLYCAIGYISAILCIFGYIACNYGVGRYIEGIKQLFTMTENATSYSPIVMLVGNIKVYGDYIGWFVLGVILTIGGMVVFKLFEKKFILLKQIVFCIVMVAYVLYLHHEGNFTIKYTNYSSMFFWGVMFLIFILGFSIYEVLNSKQKFEFRVLAMINIVIIFITPIGSNNNLYSTVNNLFLASPMVINFVGEMILDARMNISLKRVDINLFPLKMFCVTMIGLALVQSFLFGLNYVYRDGDNGEQRNYQITNNDVLQGMYTNEKNAIELQGLNDYLRENKLTGKEVIIFGEIPAVAFYFSLEPAISSTWPDLPSFSSEKFCDEIDAIEQEEKMPIVIVSKLDSINIQAYSTVDEVQTEWEKKIKRLQLFLYNNNYEQSYANDKYVVYEKEVIKQ